MDSKVEQYHNIDWRLAESQVAHPEIISFDQFRIDCARRRLLREGRPIRIQQKPLDLLIYLARHHTRVVSRQELLDRFWPRTVNEEALTRCVSTVRRLLGDAREPSRYIETLWGQGYRFVAPIAIQPVRHDTAAGPQGASAGEPTGDERLRFGARATRLAAWLILPAAALALALALAASLRTAPESTGVSHTAEVHSMAVLPMAARAESDAWLAAALTDHLIQTIARIDGLKVVARGSAAHFHADSDPVEVGARLGVDALLVTRLDRTGKRTGLRAQLVSTRDGSLLWGFDVAPKTEGAEDEQVRQLARSVASRLWAKLQLRPSDRPVAPAAYRLYLRGRYLWNQRSSVALTAAIDAYEAALAIEPDYVDALLGLADSWLVMSNYSAVSPDDTMPKARAAAERALALDPEAAHAFAVLGVIAMQYDWDWSTAEAHLRRALTLNPNDASAEQWLGELYCYRRRPDECRAHLLAAVGLDPLSPVLRMMQGSPALFSGHFDGAVTAYAQALKDAPNFPFTRYVLGLAYAGLGEWERAIASYEASLPDLGMAIVGGPLAFALARNGETTRAEALIAQLEELAAAGYLPPTKLATAWLGLGDRERALESLSRALEVRDDRLVYLAVDSHFTELHADDEFRACAERVGLLDVL